MSVTYLGTSSRGGEDWPGFESHCLSNPSGVFFTKVTADIAKTRRHH
jgi:hypothetical protein